MKFYLAARPTRLKQLRQAEEALICLGHESVTRWLHNDEDTEINGGEPLVYGSDSANQFALHDLCDVASCDVLITFTEDRGSLQRGGGRFVELGYALALNKRVITIGQIENLFIGLTDVYPDWGSFLDRGLSEAAEHAEAGEQHG